MQGNKLNFQQGDDLSLWVLKLKEILFALTFFT